MELSTRRAMLGTVGAVAIGATAASCTQAQIDDLQAKVADIINQVQAGVAKACEAVGKFVPTANSVIAVLVALGGTNPLLITAQMITAAITEITKACPAVQGRHPGVTVHGVNVVFY